MPFLHFSTLGAKARHSLFSSILIHVPSTLGEKKHYKVGVKKIPTQPPNVEPVKHHIYIYVHKGQVGWVITRSAVGTQLLTKYRFSTVEQRQHYCND